ncbi:NAD(P)H-quinone oxidoreductase subunit U, chloroplastic [Andrographis paniculata]|uniref:NAD(P)H-quinone oxidoreductase subunit U, chloroplastic n=1 Tax=Andrographis paniculata TaxID=175694 RepID=UPI0021E8EBE0|nr:NAD(P)H-quinone oxidoreductase subunit U, chloroplastic [Andrographis paniculata]
MASAANSGPPFSVETCCFRRRRRGTRSHVVSLSFVFLHFFDQSKVSHRSINKLTAAAATSPRAAHAGHYPTRFRTTKQQKLPSSLRMIRNCSDGSESAMATEEESEAPMEVPQGPPSLISALNVEKALRGIAITDVDHYGRLGLRSGCSYEEVDVAYKNKIAEATNKGLSEEELGKELELLKESHDILSSVEERRMYDWSLARSGKPEKYMWPFEVDITQTPTAIPPPREPEDEGPTRLVGYFMLSWLLLSFVLYIVFNR